MALSDLWGAYLMSATKILLYTIASAIGIVGWVWLFSFGWQLAVAIGLVLFANNMQQSTRKGGD